ncbi:MAG: PAS domain-containing protein [Kiritimatiellia bacterium]
MPSTPTMKDHRSLFRQLLLGMYDAVLITDPSGHLLELNPRAKEFFRYEIDEVMDSPVGKFIPGVTPEIVERIRSGLEQARHMMLDANCLRKDGTSFPAEVTVSLIDLLDPGDLVFTIRNVERRRRQLAILRTRQNAYEIAQAALFACAPDGRFRGANAACLEMFGYESEEEIQKLSFADLMDDAPMADLFACALAGETNTVRITAQEDDADAKDVEIQLAPDRQGKKIVGVVGSIIRV